MLTRPIPPMAMLVVEVIRREVTRPSVLPTLFDGRPPLGALRWEKEENLFCPMGLCPRATQPTPTTPTGFGYECHPNSVMIFGDWWDRQTDPQGAVDAVWGTI